tara:strand:+ start:200 stop:469 length:270 start_codon:yes stop_codon:yes gene_type:complete
MDKKEQANFKDQLEEFIKKNEKHLKSFLDSAKKFKLFVEKIKETNETSKTSVVAEDPIEKIRKLSQLKDDGIISEEEFEEKKKTLLKEI